MYLNEVARYMHLFFTFYSFIAFVCYDSRVQNRLPIAVA